MIRTDAMSRSDLQPAGTYSRSPAFVDDSHDDDALINLKIASLFLETAMLLDNRRPNDFRARIFRRGAAVLRELMWPVDWMLQMEGRAEIERIPGLGRALALGIQQIVETGELALLSQLQGRRLVPAKQRISNFLQERKQKIPLRPANAQLIETSTESLREIAEILSVDAEYRRRAAGNELPCIAPRRFNPSGEAWLPILNTERTDNSYKALFSNTAHAHELGMTQDWVIIRRDDSAREDQWTVITSQFGTLEGRRIVRGREIECREFYRRYPRTSQREYLANRSSDGGTRQLTLFDAQTA